MIKTMRGLIGAAMLWPLALWAQTSVPTDTNLDKILHSAWTDGDYYVEYVPHTVRETMGIPNPSTENNGVLFFAGGSLHEGGTHFCVEKKDKAFVVSNRTIDPYQWFQVGSTLTYNERADCILVKDSGIDMLQGVLKRLDSPDELPKFICDELRTFAIAGKYVDEKGNSCIFSEKENKVNGAMFPNSHYVFGEEYDTPCLYLEFPDRIYKAVRTPDKLVLKPMNKDEKYGDYSSIPDEPEIVLKRIFAPNEYDFPLLSKRVLTTSELMLYAGGSSISYLKDKYADSVLQVAMMLEYMRHEVYARHHLAFSEMHWQEKFSKKTWYKPEKDYVTNLLSETEWINTELMRFLYLKLMKDVYDFERKN